MGKCGFGMKTGRSVVNVQIRATKVVVCQLCALKAEILLGAHHFLHCSLFSSAQVVWLRNFEAYLPCCFVFIPIEGCAISIHLLGLWCGDRVLLCSHHLSTIFMLNSARLGVILYLTCREINAFISCMLVHCAAIIDWNKWNDLFSYFTN